MRPSCLYCCSKHVAQAIVLMLEAHQGYPLYRWLAVGHLAEAGDETVDQFPELAERIRAQRLILMGQADGELHLMDLLAYVRAVAIQDGQTPDIEFLGGTR